MSQSTSLLYYRPEAPPTVTGRDVAQFVSAASKLDVVNPTGFRNLNVKYGRSIDQKASPMAWMRSLIPGISVSEEIDWDVDASTDFDRAIASLEERPIYRAWVSFGTLSLDACDAVRRPADELNDEPFKPHELSLTFDNIKLWSMSSDESHENVGWIALSIWGYGYLYPWTLADAVERLQSVAGLNELVALAEQHWPVTARAPHKREIQQRKSLGAMWPYSTHDRPIGWVWGVQESG